MFFSLSWTVICSQNVCCLLFFVLTVFTHRYGRDGRDTKKYEDSCLLFDYEFLQNLSSPQSVQHYKSCLATFIDLLNENATTGNHNRRNHLSWATFSNTRFFTPDFSSFSTISDVRSFMVARMHTADPSVKIHLSFEVPYIFAFLFLLWIRIFLFLAQL
jgi:hypothetical protein